MRNDLVSKIERYAEMVESALRYEDREELINLFITREAIQDALDAGALPPLDVLQLLDAADSSLAERHRQLGMRFPDAFRRRPSNVPRRYWWWYLDEGPQVRERARGAA